MHHVIAPRLRALTLAALLLAGGVACSADFKEGEHYKALKPAQPTSVGPGKVEVVEVFWYACGHCFLIEPTLESWARKEQARQRRARARARDVERPAQDARARLLYG